MIEIDFQPWIDQVSSHPGVLACAVKGAQTISVKSIDAAFPEKKIRELLTAFSEVALTLKQDHLTGGRWRWIFENGQIHSARRADGSFAVLILTNDPAMGALADSALHEFVATPAFEDIAAEMAVPPQEEGLGTRAENGAIEPAFPETQAQ